MAIEVPLSSTQDVQVIHGDGSTWSNENGTLGVLVVEQMVQDVFTSISHVDTHPRGLFKIEEVPKCEPNTQ